MGIIGYLLKPAAKLLTYCEIINQRLVLNNYMSALSESLFYLDFIPPRSDKLSISFNLEFNIQNQNYICLNNDIFLYYTI